MKKRPDWLKTRIFLDSGDSEETRKSLGLLGFLDGQTTNPTLVAKNPEVQVRLKKGEKFARQEIYDFYFETVNKISAIIPHGSVSVEVYSDATTMAEEMLIQTREMFSWIPNAHIKFPITVEGLKAANMAIQENIRVNMTLCFSQEQAAAVHMAVGDSRKGRVFVSPFVGRLDDIGLKGVDLVENILKMYRESDDKGFGHVEVLAASIRNLEQFLYMIKIGADIITAPFRVLEDWAKSGLVKPEDDFNLQASDLKPISYRSDVKLVGDWQEINIQHELTDAGLKKFADDWNKLII